MQAETHGSTAPEIRKREPGDWRTRIILGQQVGLADFPDWLGHSYEKLRSLVLHPDYPCYFGTMAERRGEMFYSYVRRKDIGELPSTMATFARLANQPAFRKHNIAIFFEPDSQPLSHQAYHDRFWDTLQHLHDVDPDPAADFQPDPSDEAWEFSFGGVQMFVVCACPSFAKRHSRNLGPGMVLLFQPRAVFVDTITNKVIGREARNQVRERLRRWDDVAPHPDLGFYGDPGNLEWKQYFLADENQRAADRCPFLRRKAGRAAVGGRGSDEMQRPEPSVRAGEQADDAASLQTVARTYASLGKDLRARFRRRLVELDIPVSKLPIVRLSERSERFPLSLEQERLWFLWQLDPADTSYNITVALDLDGPLSPTALRAAFGDAVERHEILRTHFEECDGRVEQVVREDAVSGYAWTVLDARDGRDLHARLLALSKAPFDLARGPLLRVTLLRTGERAHVLHLALHHIVADHASLRVLLDEVARSYSRRRAGHLDAPPALPLQYGDVAAWRREWQDDLSEGEHLAYWVERLGREHVALELPTLPYSREIHTRTGARVSTTVGGEAFARLKRLASRHRTTLFTTLLAAYAVLLHRYSGQRDIRIGVPVAGRGRPETADLIGFFVNTLVMRAELPGGEQPFSAFVARMHERVAEAHEHQGVSFARLVEELQPERAMGHTPLFDVVFNHTRAGSGRIELAGLDTAELRFDAQSARFDLVLDVVERDDEVRVAFHYAAERFDDATVARMLDRYVDIVAWIGEHPDGPLGRIGAADSRPQRAARPAAFEPVGRRFSAQAMTRAASCAIDCEGEQLRYRDLEAWSNRIANALIAAGVRADERVGLCIERSPALVAAVLGVLKSGAAFVPLDPAYPVERLGIMLDDANAARVLVDAAGRARLGALCDGRDAIDVHALASGHADAPEVAIHPGQLAYVIYTSGSTGKPKGVAITQGTLSQHLHDFIGTYGITHADRQLQSSTLNFDVALHELLPALLCGGRVEMRGAGLWDPQTMNRHLVDGGVTFARIPTAYWQQWLRNPPEAGKLALRQITVGGEGLPGDALKQWYAGPLRHIRVDNLYGPTETTIACMYRRTTADDAEQAIVSIGTTYPSRSAHVLDTDGNEVPVGGIGELCIGGHTLARGYLGRPALTAARFVPDPFDEAGARLYRTGDLCRRRGDGGIDFLGRLDQQIKLRGFRVEPGEIEAALRDVAGIEAAVVAVHGEGDGRRLVAYLCVDASADGHAQDDAAVRRALERRLPGYMVPATFMRIDRLPTMQNGKVDRAALPVPDAALNRREAVAPRSALERTLLDIWQTVLACDGLGVTDNFFEAGGHSLLLMQVAARARRALGIDVSLQTLFQHPVLESLAAELAARGQNERRAAGAIARRAPGSRIPLSHGQERLWFVWKLDPHSAAYTIARAIRIAGMPDVPALRQALDHLVARHEILRTRFVDDDGVACQIVDTEVAYEWLSERVDSAATLEARVRELARAPFDLERGHALRVALLSANDTESAVLFAMPHIVSDAWSQRIFLHEFAQFYRAACGAGEARLAPLPVQFGDYAAWQRAGGEAREHDADAAYWQGELAGEQPRLALPADRVRTGARSGEGAWTRRTLEPRIVQALEAFSRERGVTRFTTMLAAYGALLHAMCAQDDVRIGVPVAGRHDVETEPLIGFFVNTLVIRVQARGGAQPFGALLEHVRDKVVAAHAHARLPFAMLVERLQPRRSLDETPLFQTMFNYSGQKRAALDLHGLDAQVLGMSTGTSQFDLTLEVAGDEDVSLALNYATDLLDRETAERLLDHYVDVLRQIAFDGDARAIVLPGNAERAELLHWGRREAAHGEPEPVHVSIARQARENPSATALVVGDQALTYAQLDARANRLAHWLVRHGVGPEVCVGLAVERSVEMVVGLLAILKAGGAYVPLDPSYPAERLAYMASDSGVTLLLTQSQVRAALRLPDDVYAIELDRLDVSQEASDDPGVAPDAENLAYVIYTSGSTGKPKGVMVRHRGLAHFVRGIRQTPGIDADDVFVAVTSLSFDIAALELYVPLAAGACVVVASRDVARDGASLAALLDDAGATAMQATPATWRMLLDTPWRHHGFKALCGGEALAPDLAARLRERGVALWNLYGPTETTIWSSLQRVDARPHLGRPLPGTRLYVLDGALNPSPIGAPGELYIGGVGIARGYLKRAGLTAERFVPDPFDDAPGARLYRTGDTARWTRTGELEYLGRLDHQVKIRGFRIESGEIEAHLLAQSDVRDAVAVVVRRPSGARLAACVTPQPGREIDPAQLRDALGRALPDYMVPAAIVVLDALPLTPNGKVDRNALPEPEFAPRNDEAPLGEAETLLARVWTDVLDVERIGRHDNFFELGGDSILSLRVVARVRDRGWHITPRQMFERQTIAQLAQVISPDEDKDKDAAMRGDERDAHRPLLARVASGDAEVQEVHPATPLQAGLLFHSLREVGRGVYVNQRRYTLDGPVDAVALRSVWDRLVARHDALRTVFSWDHGDDVLQIVRKRASTPFVQHDWTSLTQADYDDRVSRWLRDDLARGFDLGRGPLLRINLFARPDGRHDFVWTDHHVLMDGWSAAQLLGEMLSLYCARTTNTPADLPAPVPWRRYAEWLAKQPDARGWWMREVQRIDDPATLAASLPFASADATREEERAVRQIDDRLDADLTARLREAARRHQVTLHTLVQAAWAVVLARHGNREQVAFGVTLSGRDDGPDGIERMLGLFINSLPVWVDVRAADSLDGWLRALQDHTSALRGHANVSLSAIQGWAGRSGDALFDSLLVFENYPVDAALRRGRPGFTVSAKETAERTHYPLVLAVVPGEHLQVRWKYRPERFDVAAVQRLREAWRFVLAQIAAGACRHVGDLVAAPQPAPQPQARRVSAPRADGRLRTVASRVSAQASRHPGRTAVHCEGTELTYGELEALANRVARRLGRLGVGPDERVGLCVGRSPELVAAMLGIWKSGAAFVPLDPAYPRDRLEWMLDDARVSRVVVDATSLAQSGGFIDTRQQIVLQDLAGEAAAHVEQSVQPEQLAYVIYTSGSSGRPKGVAVSHASLGRHLDDFIATYGISDRDRQLQSSTINFDVALHEMLPALCEGGSVEMRGPAQWDLDTTSRHLVERKVTFARIPTAYWQQWLRTPPPVAALAALRQITVGGEALPGDALARWQAGPLAHIRLDNLYGPTETTIACMYRRTIEADAGSAVVSIGATYPSRYAVVLDPAGHEAPVDGVGELCIGGATLARGYLDRPALTAARFVPDPFSDDGARLYRTGDLCRRRPDGRIDFLGRLDHQVKLRGQRIETGEVEAAMRRVAGVSDAVVTLCGDGEHRQLVGYVVGDAAPDGLRRRLGEQLPAYMVPSAFVHLAAWPLMPNGKVDRAALPSPQTSGTQRVAAGTALEAALLAIMRDVLDAAGLGVTDDFFVAGGHSLLALKVLSRAAQAGLTGLTLEALFQYRTARALAAQMEADGRRRGAPAGGGASNIVRMNRGGARVNLFAIHPASGLVADYRPLAAALDGVATLHGVQAPFYTESWWADDIDALLADYAARIRAVQPSGPYRLIGWSVGGVIAAQLARKLVEDGHDVAFTGLIDAHVLDFSDGRDTTPVTRDEAATWRASGATLRDAMDGLARKWPGLAPDPEAPDTRALLSQVVLFSRHLGYMARQNAGDALPCDLRIWWATHEPYRALDRSTAMWAARAGGRVRVQREIATDHTGIVRHPALLDDLVRLMATHADLAAEPLA